MGGDEIPDAGLEHEAQWVHGAGDDAVGPLVVELHALPVPHALGDGREVRHRLAGTEPAGRVEVEPLEEAARAAPELGGQRGQDLEPGRRDHGPEPELGGRAGEPGEEQGVGFLGRHAGEPGAVAVDQADAAVRPAVGGRSAHRRHPAPRRRGAPSGPRPPTLRRAPRRSCRRAPGAAAAARRGGKRACRDPSKAATPCQVCFAPDDGGRACRAMDRGYDLPVTPDDDTEQAQDSGCRRARGRGRRGDRGGRRLGDR